MDNQLVESYKTQNIALKLKLNPTKEQYQYLLKCFGCERFVYNYYLNSKNSFYETNIKPLREEFGYFDLLEKQSKLKEDIKAKSETLKKAKKNQTLKADLKELRQKLKDLNIEIEAIRKHTNKEYANYNELPIKELKERNPWLKEADSQGISNAYMNLSSAFKNFYEGRAHLPKFHSRKTKNSFKNSMMKQNCLNWNEHTIEAPKIGKIKFYNSKAPKWYKNKIKVCSLTFSKTPVNEIYVSVLFEIRVEAVKKQFNDENQAIGLDFDCDDMYIDSNGKSALKDFGFKKQKQNKAKKLAKLQRRKERKTPGSKNKEKARIKLALFEEHIANCRKDWIEKETKRLTDKYQLIGLENLSIQGMMKGSKNAKNYQDIAWSTFVGKLMQKAENKNCQIIKIDKFFASSQACSCCGFKNPEVQKRHLERWTCPKCGQEHQRDINASINIKNEAIRVLREAEESSEKTFSEERRLPKGQNSVSLAEELANLALCEA